MTAPEPRATDTCNPLDTSVWQGGTDGDGTSGPTASEPVSTDSCNVKDTSIWRPDADPIPPGTIGPPGPEPEPDFDPDDAWIPWVEIFPVPVDEYAQLKRCSDDVAVDLWIKTKNLGFATGVDITKIYYVGGVCHYVSSTRAATSGTLASTADSYVSCDACAVVVPDCATANAGAPASVSFSMTPGQWNATGAGSTNPHVGPVTSGTVTMTWGGAFFGYANVVITDEDNDPPHDPFGIMRVSLACGATSVYKSGTVSVFYLGFSRTSPYDDRWVGVKISGNDDDFLGTYRRLLVGDADYTYNVGEDTSDISAPSTIVIS